VTNSLLKSSEFFIAENPGFKTGGKEKRSKQEIYSKGGYIFSEAKCFWLHLKGNFLMCHQKIEGGIFDGKTHYWSIRFN
jgi:hypothetical protein